MDVEPLKLSVEYAVGRIAAWLHEHPEYDARLAEGGCLVKRRGLSPADESAVGAEYVSRACCGGPVDPRGASAEACRDLRAALYDEDAARRREEGD